MDSHSSDKISSDDPTKMSEAGLTPRRILNGTAYKSASKHPHPFYEAATLRGGFGISAIPSSPRLHTVPTLRISTPLPTELDLNHNTGKLQSKSLSDFPNFPASVGPKILSKLKSSMNRLAQSDSNISISSLSKHSQNIPRRPTTIHVTRKESFKPPTTASSQFRYLLNSDRNKPSSAPAKSWKNEVILASFTTMNPNASNLESLSLEELEKKITEKASQLSFNQSPYGDVTRQLSRYIGKPSYGRSIHKPPTSAASTRSEVKASQQGSFPQRLAATSPRNNKEIVPRGSSEFAFFSPGQEMTPSFTEFVQTDIARRMLRMLEGIGIGHERPATPNTAKNETLERLKKAFDILQEELNTMNIDEEAFLESRGLRINNEQTHFPELGNIVGNKESSVTKLPRTATARKGMRGRTAPMQEICDTFKGPRVPKLSDYEVKLRTMSKPSGMIRPATAQPIKMSPFVSITNIHDDILSRKQKYIRWADEYRANLKTASQARPLTSIPTTDKKLNARSSVKSRLDMRR